MKTKILITLMTALCALGPVLAQQQADPPQVNGGPRCTRTTTDLEGLQDSFNAPSEPTTPSPALQAYLAGPGRNPVHYDFTKPNHHVGESFLVCPCESCGAKLEIRVRPTNPKDVWTNDTYVVGIAPFGAGEIIATGQIWNGANDTAPKTITIPLSGQALSKLLCTSKSQFLDVIVQDDTTVDWMRLTIQQP